MSPEKSRSEALDSEARLRIDSQVEEYEIRLRAELDWIEQQRAIEKKKRSFREQLVQYELDDLKRSDVEIRGEEASLVNWNFWLTLSISLAVVLLALLFSDSVREIANGVSNFVVNNLSWFYVFLASSFLIYLFYLAFSKYGGVVLGAPNEKAEFSKLSWFAMLFSAGMGVGILFWGAAEPLKHLTNAPLAESGTPRAAGMAMAFSAFHWGLHAWGIYTVCAVGVAYYGFRKRKRYLISSSIMDVTRNRNVAASLKVIVDLVATLAIVFGVATSLGLALMQIGGGMKFVFDVDADGKLGYFIIVAVMTFFYILSSSTGLNRGIKILSNINMLVAVALLLFVFAVGPKLFILKLFVDSIGQYLHYLPMLSFKVDPFVASYETWMKSWTLSYFTWWIAWAPFVGIFVARISKGRTIRELILGSLIIPAIFCILWFSVFGGTAMYMEVFENAGLAAIVNQDVTASLFALFERLPMSTITSVTAIVLLFTFLITSADSATFVIAMMTSKGDLEPSVRLKVTWGLVLATLTYLLVVGGGLEALQAASLVFAFPFALVLILVIFSVTFRLSIQVKAERM